MTLLSGCGWGLNLGGCRTGQFSVQSVTPSAATFKGGTELVLDGCGFSSHAQVLLGALSCPVSSASASRLTCVTPAGSVGAVAVTVTNGQSTTTLDNGFAYETIAYAPGQNGMVAYAIHPTFHTLSQIGVTPNVPCSSAGGYNCLVQMGNYFYALDGQNSSTIFILSAVPGTGVLEPTAQSPFLIARSLSWSDSLLVDPLSQWLYLEAMDSASGIESLFTLNQAPSTGALSWGASNWHYLYDPFMSPPLFTHDDKVLFGNGWDISFANPLTAGIVTGSFPNSSAGVTYSGPAAALNQVTPGGPYYYGGGLEAGKAYVTQSSFNTSTNSWTQIGSGAIALAASTFEPATLSLSQDAQYLYAVVQPTLPLYVFSVSNGAGTYGQLTLTPTTYSLGATEAGFDPTGKYLLVITLSQVLSMQYNSTNGALTQVAAAPFTGAYASSFVQFSWDFTGTTVFAGTQGFYFNPQTGTLTSLIGSANPLTALSNIIIGF